MICTSRIVSLGDVGGFEVGGAHASALLLANNPVDAVPRLTSYNIVGVRQQFIETHMRLSLEILLRDLAIEI